MAFLLWPLRLVSRAVSGSKICNSEPSTSFTPPSGRTREAAQRCSWYGGEYGLAQANYERERRRRSESLLAVMPNHLQHDCLSAPSPEGQNRAFGLHQAFDNDAPRGDPFVDPAPDLRRTC